MTETVVQLGEGCDHVTYLVNDVLVVRAAKLDGEGADASRLEAEAQLLRVVAEVSPLPVPEPLFVVPEARCLGYMRMPGVPLLEVPHDRRIRDAQVVAGPLGRLLAALHAVAVERVADLVEVDDTAPEEWLGEAAAHRAAVDAVIPQGYRGGIDAFLAASPPAASENLVFTHNDLGVEHVLVDPATLEVTGVIDWSDAAIADPAYDFGLLLRDLGPAALDAVLAAYGDQRADVALRERAGFYARCSVLEDLAYGQERGLPAYSDKSIAALEWLFPSG